MVVYGHTPVPEAEWLNKTIDIDTGCVFGGKLTALRYPERELVEVKAKKVYAESKKPIKIVGGNFAVGSPIIIKLNGVNIAQTISDVEGKFYAKILVPNIGSGFHRLQIIQNDINLNQQFIVRHID